MLCRGTDAACALGTAERGRLFVKRGGVGVLISADQDEESSPVEQLRSLLQVDSQR